ncbi:JAB domain-containing protein, partial [Escherichia coli]
RGIVFPGKSFFSAHEVSTCKISGCLSYRILDSGPDGTQTTLTIAKALALVEVRVLDHLVVGNEVVSFAECGLL